MAKTPYKKGFTFTLNVTQGEVSSVDVSSLALNLPMQLAKLGIKVQVNTVASDGDFVAAVAGGKYRRGWRMRAQRRPRPGMCSTCTS